MINWHIDCSIYSHVHQMKAFDKTVIIDGNEGSIRLGELSSNLRSVKCAHHISEEAFHISHLQLWKLLNV